VSLHPQDLSVIDGYASSIVGIFVMKCSALSRYRIKYCRCGSIVILIDPSDTELA